MRLLFFIVLSIASLLPARLLAEEIALFTIDLKGHGTELPDLDITLGCDFDKPIRLNLAVSAEQSRTVTVPAPAERGMTCTLTPQPFPGREYSFRGDGGSQFELDDSACRFTGVRRGHHNFCQIEIETRETTLTVFKHWIGTSRKEEDVQIALDCGPGPGLRPRSVNSGKPVTWSFDTVAEEGVRCSVAEQQSDSYVQDVSDCQDLLISPGAEEECTIVNTKVVKMIEMLNRYGLVLMILAFMVVGMFAARRAMP